MRALLTCQACLSLLLAAGCQTNKTAPASPGLMHYTKPTLMTHEQRRVLPIGASSQAPKSPTTAKGNKPVKLPVPFQQDPADGQNAQ